MVCCIKQARHKAKPNSPIQIYGQFSNYSETFFMLWLILAVNITAFDKRPDCDVWCGERLGTVLCSAIYIYFI